MRTELDRPNHAKNDFENLQAKVPQGRPPKAADPWSALERAIEQLPKPRYLASCGGTFVGAPAGRSNRDAFIERLTNTGFSRQEADALPEYGPNQPEIGEGNWTVHPGAL